MHKPHSELKRGAYCLQDLRRIETKGPSVEDLVHTVVVEPEDEEQGLAAETVSCHMQCCRQRDRTVCRQLWEACHISLTTVTASQCALLTRLHLRVREAIC